jgi:hypothetical protein
VLEYSAQDFWVYLGRRLGRGLPYLIPFLEGGSFPADVDETLRDDLQSADVPDLGSAFWEWTKNQVYEKSVDLGSQELGGACEFNADVSALRNLEYDPNALPPSTGIQLDPLTSEVVKVTFLAPAGYTAYVRVESSSDEIVAKAYESGKPDCHRQPESREARVDIHGAPKTFYVLVSNTGISRTELANLRIVLLKVFLSPSTVALRGSAGQRLTGAFALTNASDKPVSFSALPLESWIELTGNPAGTLAPNETILVDIAARCALSGGNGTGTISLEFRSESGVRLTGNDVPKKVDVRLDCSRDCTELTKYRRLTGSVSFSWNDSFSRTVGTVSNRLTSSFSSGGGVVLVGGASGWTTGFGSIGSVNSSVNNEWERQEATRPPHTLTILESGNGGPLEPSFVLVRLNQFTCRYSVEIGIIVPGEETTTFDGKTTVKPTAFGITARVFDQPVTAGDVDIGGSASIQYTGTTRGTHFIVASQVSGNLISMKRFVNQPVSATSVTWLFAFEE